MIKTKKNRISCHPKDIGSKCDLTINPKCFGKGHLDLSSKGRKASPNETGNDGNLRFPCGRTRTHKDPKPADFDAVIDGQISAIVVVLPFG